MAGSRLADVAAVLAAAVQADAFVAVGGGDAATAVRRGADEGSYGFVERAAASRRPCRCCLATLTLPQVRVRRPPPNGRKQAANA